MTKNRYRKSLFWWGWGRRVDSGCSWAPHQERPLRPVTQGSTLPVNKHPGYCPMADSSGDVFYRKRTTFPTNNLVILFPFQTLPHKWDEEFAGELVCSLWKSPYFILTKKVLGHRYMCKCAPPQPTCPNVLKSHDAFRTISSLCMKRLRKTRFRALFLLGNTPRGRWHGKRIRSWFKSDTL